MRTPAEFMDQGCGVEDWKLNFVARLMAGIRIAFEVWRLIELSCVTSAIGDVNEAVRC
jgi:hypothetical protein